MPKILVVDDEPTFLTIIAAYIGQAIPNSTITVACDGASAIEALRRNPPDFVVSDIQMPGMDGFALLRAIKRDPGLSAVQVFMMSGSNDVFFSTHARRLGAKGFIPKNDFQVLSVRLSAA